jgi:hypothetical protein
VFVKVCTECHFDRQEENKIGVGKQVPLALQKICNFLQFGVTPHPQHRERREKLSETQWYGTNRIRQVKLEVTGEKCSLGPKKISGSLGCSSMM